jgi:hypothetical protein
VIAVCFIATLINPFGYQAYFESFRHASNPYLRNVMEWEGVGEGCPGCHPRAVIAYSAVFGLCALYAIKQRNWYALPSVALFLIMASPTWSTRRLLPIFAVVTLPLLAETLSQIRLEIDKYRITPYLYLLIFIVCLEFAFVNRFTAAKLYHYGETEYCSFSANCPIEATNFLISHPPAGKGLTFYDWGGYLIGKGVPVKLFIDGRMHVWRTEEGYQPFGDYIEMYYHARDDIFLKYDFDWVFLPTGSDLVAKLLDGKILGHWKVAYQDDRAVYLIRERSL